MKITFTLDQMKQFNSLTADERNRFIAKCEELSQLPDDAINSYHPGDDDHAMLAEVHTTMMTRVEAKRRRAARKAGIEAKNPASCTETGSEIEKSAIDISVSESTAKAAAWVRTNYKRFSDNMIQVFCMLGDSGMVAGLKETWQLIDSIIYRSIAPLLTIAEQFMHLPRSNRREAVTFSIPSKAYTTLADKAVS